MNCYWPPESSNFHDRDFLSSLENNNENANIENRETIVIGDLNCFFLEKKDRKVGPLYSLTFNKIGKEWY